MRQVRLGEATAWGSPPTEDEYQTPGFVRSLSARIVEELQLGPKDLFVDLCCGTGVFSAAVLELVRLTFQVVAVDRSDRALARLPRSAGIRPVVMDASAFATFPCRYDKILLKDGIACLGHRQHLLASLRERLAPGGILLFVDQTPNVGLPLFQEAFGRWKAQHVAPGELEHLLRTAGFETRASAVRFSRRIEPAAYFRLLEARGLPALDGFDDEELREGVAWVRKECSALDAIDFDDRFDVMAASVSGAVARRAGAGGRRGNPRRPIGFPAALPTR
jgi:SAM-dependent methyltransferase